MGDSVCPKASLYFFRRCISLNSAGGVESRVVQPVAVTMPTTPSRLCYWSNSPAFFWRDWQNYKSLGQGNRYPGIATTRAFTYGLHQPAWCLWLIFKPTGFDSHLLLCQSDLTILGKHCNVQSNLSNSNLYKSKSWTILSFFVGPLTIIYLLHDFHNSNQWIILFFWWSLQLRIRQVWLYIIVWPFIVVQDRCIMR